MFFQFFLTPHASLLIIYNMTIQHLGQQILLFLVLTISTLGLEVKVLTGMTMRGFSNQPDIGEQKIVLNSNNRFVYPSQHTA